MREYPVQDVLGQTVEAGDLIAWGIKSELTIGKAEYSLFHRFVDSDGQVRHARVTDPLDATHCKFTVRRIFNMGTINCKHVETGESAWYVSNRNRIDPDPTKWQAERASAIQPGTHFIKLTDEYTELLRGKAAV